MMVRLQTAPRTVATAIQPTMPEQWIRHHMLGKQRRRIGAHTEKRRMPQRHDAGIAQDQVQ
jgi:hypothetical protein